MELAECTIVMCLPLYTTALCRVVLSLTSSAESDQHHLKTAFRQKRGYARYSAAASKWRNTPAPHSRSPPGLNRLFHKIPCVFQPLPLKLCKEVVVTFTILTVNAITNNSTAFSLASLAGCIEILHAFCNNGTNSNYFSADIFSFPFLQ